MIDTTRIRRPFVVVAWCLFGLGVLLLSASLGAYGLNLDLRFALLLVAMLVAENYALAMPSFGVSLTYPLLIAVQVLCGPTATLLAAAFIAVSIQELRAKLPLSVYAFNVGQLMLSNGLGAWVYVALGGRVLTSQDGMVTQFGNADFPGLLIPLAAMIVVGVAGNLLFLATGISLRHSMRFRQVLVELRWLPPVQIALAGVGILLAQVMAGNMIALPLFVFPLFVARQFYQRFIKLQEAYTDTIRSIVGALEAKDPYTRGHSERVAEYATGLARAVGMSDREVSDVETAALLHDIGKLAIDGRILRKTARLDAEEWDLIRSHPERGAAMVSRVAHLRHLAEHIAKHHERLDGSGYPLALDGENIPLTARILAIADSYDAMTTDRPYRKGFTMAEALADLGQGSGVSYDDDLVGQFNGWLHSEQDAQAQPQGVVPLSEQGAPS